MKTIGLLILACSVFAVTLEHSAVEEFVKGNHKFTANVYKEILKKDPGNFIVSPFSAEVVLALTNEGARGTTSAELATGLSLPSTKEVTRNALKSLLPNLKRSNDDVKLLSANKIYVAKGLKLEDDFRSVANHVYNAGVDNADFAESDRTVAEINRWVEDNTNHKIRDLFTENDIDDSTKIVLVNALYFSGTWLAGFDDNQTGKRKFYTTRSDASEVDTMFKTEVFNYYNSPTLNAKFLELPFIGEDVNMVIVLPNEIDGLVGLEQNIDQVLGPQPLEYNRVFISLPKFTIESKIDFIPILKDLGVTKLFDDADLSGISTSERHLKVSKVKQKAFINVTEAGVEAAAATGVAEDKSLQNDNFLVDHPFLYFIKQKDTLLFIGRYVNPNL